jgi:hypothetical protein
MKPPVGNSSARQDTGGPFSVLDPKAVRKERVRNPTGAELGREITALVGHSTKELRLAWRKLHRTGPPPGLSRDLLTRGIADKLQQLAHAGASRALQRRLQVLAGASEDGARARNPGRVLKTGTILVRQWRGYSHTVLVKEDGFEYQGECYRSLSVVAERITGAHWSGPRFFGLTQPAPASLSAGAGQ